MVRSAVHSILSAVPRRDGHRPEHVNVDTNAGRERLLPLSEIRSTLILMQHDRYIQTRELLRRWLVSNGEQCERRSSVQLSDHDGYRGCIVAQMPAGKSCDLVEQAAHHAVSIRRAMSNNRFQKAIVTELEALC